MQSRVPPGLRGTTGLTNDLSLRHEGCVARPYAMFTIH